MKRKLNSFTLIEMITVLAISSIVIFLAILFLQKVWFSFYHLKKNSEDANKEFYFLSNMQNDINYADVIRWEQDVLELYKRDTLKFEYYFEKDIIIKTDDFRSDTLVINIDKIDTTNIYSPFLGDYVTSITLNAINEMDTNTFYLTKNYDKQTTYILQNKLK